MASVVSKISRLEKQIKELKKEETKLQKQLNKITQKRLKLEEQLNSYLNAIEQVDKGINYNNENISENNQQDTSINSDTYYN
jgi:chromosome segregation ATPase